MNALTQALELTTPAIIQAPMAGGSCTPELVAAVANGGGLGSFATGYLTSEQVEAGIKAIKQLTDKPFAANLFVPGEIELKTEYQPNIPQINAYQQQLNKFRMQLGIAEEPVVNNTHNIKLQNNFFELVDILLAENIQVISFTFGNLPAEIIQTFKTNGAYLIGTATCLAEAKLLADSGIDAIVAQGYEAGGHRGNFINKASQTSIATMALVPQLVSHIDRPVIAAGGIMDGRGIVAALALGASAVQMGTAFLTTVESGCHPAYKAALLKAKNSDVDTTTLTKVYSGKTVRGLHNHFIEHMEEKRVDIPPYPIANALTSPIRKAAAQQQARDIMSIWSGQGVSLVTEQLSVQGLLTKLNTEVKENLQQLVTTFGKMES